MDILTTNSLDVPYEDTTYQAIISEPFNIKPTNHTIIYARKVQTKRYEECTYFKFILPMKMEITSEENVHIELIDGDKHIMFLMPIKNNILRGETVQLRWEKFPTLPKEPKPPDMADIQRLLPNFDPDYQIRDYPISIDPNTRWTVQRPGMYTPGTVQRPGMYTTGTTMQPMLRTSGNIVGLAVSPEDHSVLATMNAVDLTALREQLGITDENIRGLLPGEIDNG